MSSHSNPGSLVPADPGVLSTNLADVPTSDMADPMSDRAVELAAEIIEKLGAKFPDGFPPQWANESALQWIVDAMMVQFDEIVFEKSVGPVLTSAQAAKVAGVSRQIIHRRAKAGRLLAYKGRGGRLLYPDFQFSTGANVRGDVLLVINILSPALQDPRDVVCWLRVGTADLDGRSWFELLDEGKLDTVLSAARGYSDAAFAGKVD